MEGKEGGGGGVDGGGGLKCLLGRATLFLHLPIGTSCHLKLRFSTHILVGVHMEGGGVGKALRYLSTIQRP